MLAVSSLPAESFLFFSFLQTLPLSSIFPVLNYVRLYELKVLFANAR
jgi:hypothetical protein